jgi:hypothetical protein
MKATLSAVHSAQPLRYTDRKWQDASSLSSYLDPADIPHLGTASPQGRCPNIGYLVTDVQDELAPETLQLSDGSVRYSAGRFNLSSVRLSLGGDAGNRTLVCSLVDTLGVTPRAKQIHLLFSKEILRHGKKCGRFVILPGAAEKLQNGWRLTEGVQLLRELDFTHGQYLECFQRVRTLPI